MNEENKNTITYDEDWQSVSYPEYPVSQDETDFNGDYEAKKTPQKRDNAPKQLLITIQLIVCILIALAAFVIKNICGEFYAAAREMYYSELNNSAIFEDKDFDLSSILGLASKDEI